METFSPKALSQYSIEAEKLNKKPEGKSGSGISKDSSLTNLIA
jgi:hypothetical protein